MSAESEVFMTDESHERSEEEVVHNKPSSILNEFTNRKAGLKQTGAPRERKPLKKDTFNTHLVRATKKMVSNLSKGIKPNSNFCYFDLDDPILNKIWRSADELYYRDLPFFKSLCRAPKLKGQGSFNQSVCSNFFSTALVKEAFGLLLELMYYDNDPSKLSVNLCLNCCDQKNHSQRCVEKWQQLRAYLTEQYIDDLGASRSSARE